MEKTFGILRAVVRSSLLACPAREKMMSSPRLVLPAAGDLDVGQVTMPGVDRGATLHQVEVRIDNPNERVARMYLGYSWSVTHIHPKGQDQTSKTYWARQSYWSTEAARE